MKNLDEVLGFLGWTSESLTNLPKMQVCPFNTGHLVPTDRIEKHIERCRLRQQGYTKRQIESFWSYSSDEIQKFSEAASKSKVVELPQCSIIDPSSGQSVVNPSVQGRGETKLSDHGKAFMRDLKRRRRSYRGIHTAKKSYIEVLRDVIELHTALLSGCSISKPFQFDLLRTDRPEAQSSKSSGSRSRNPSTSVEDGSDSKSRRLLDKLPKRTDHSDGGFHHRHHSKRSRSRDRSSRRYQKA